MSDELDRFVREALTAGCGKQRVAAALHDEGWPRDAIDEALAAYADAEFPVPVPRPRPYVSAREAFVYLVEFSTLYAAALSLGALVFGLIEYALPDPAMGPTYGGVEFQRGSMRWSIAWLVIAFPVYLWLTRRTAVALRREPGKRRSRVRKWLTYVTLFVAASVVLGDVVTLIYNLLAGELTVRLLLKAATVAAIASAVFGHYTIELRRDDLDPDRQAARRPAARALGIAAVVVVAAAVVAGFLAVGSPGRARATRLDDRREGELARIADAIDRYYGQEAALPSSLSALASYRGVHGVSIQDPVSGRPYEYEPGAQRTYRLCAEFDTVERGGEGRSAAPVGDSRFWDHPAGRHCFDVEVAVDD